jgi:hypothetical protein
MARDVEFYGDSLHGLADVEGRAQACRGTQSRLETPPNASEATANDGCGLPASRRQLGDLLQWKAKFGGTDVSEGQRQSLSGCWRTRCWTKPLHYRYL